MDIDSSSCSDRDLFDCFKKEPKHTATKRKISQENEEPTKRRKTESPMSSKLIENLKKLPEVVFPELKSKEIECGLTCTHRVSLPIDLEYPVLEKNPTPYKEYSFVLDEFQKQAILCVDNNQSVVVSAHTSSGKTVVAEYAIAKSLKNQQRVIYTSPIKALSNQKYRELSENFEDIGLQTGDVTINPTAGCVIMTTEILRNMLYRGSEIMREVAWVIFDEIHYMRDAERGVVWEETIILLPDNVRYVFLSATISNAQQFAEWIASTHSQPCHVISTDYRPVPLRHYVIPTSGEELFMLMNENNQFLDKNLSNALSKNRVDQKSAQSRPRMIQNIAKFMIEKKFMPVIAFSFNKKQCEQYALKLSYMDFNDNEEKQLIEEIFNNAINSLSAADRQLIQISTCLPLLKCGIGMHHSGLLPVLKEITEILFAEGLIKILFSTETFSMGLNMPARTVLFTTCKKYDGISNRYLTASEYIQMSGRAGRRGIDERGLSVLILDENIEREDIIDMYKGSSCALDSAFRLTYNMILNLLRIEGLNPEFMMKKSFFQFQHTSKATDCHKKIEALKMERDKLFVVDQDEFHKFSTLKNQIELNKAKVNQAIRDNCFANGRFFTAGRVVRVNGSQGDFGFGIVINFYKRTSKNNGLNKDVDDLSYCDIIVKCRTSEEFSSGSVQYHYEADNKYATLIPVSLKMIEYITAIIIDINDTDKNPSTMFPSYMKSLDSITKNFPCGLPLLDPIKDLHLDSIGCDDLCKLYQSTLEMEDKLKSLPISIKMDNDANKNNQILDVFNKKASINKELEILEEDMKESLSIINLKSLKSMKQVLRKLGFINETDAIEMKGRVACEISCCDELVLTELFFNGFFNDLTPDMINSALSCFFNEEKSNEEFKGLSIGQQDMFNKIMSTAKKVASVKKECGLPLDENKYLQSFKFDLMEIFRLWSTGSSFESICLLTTAFEGSIIRYLRRLDELLKQLIAASDVIGNSELQAKFKECNKKIKRSIAFSASLYL